MSNTAKGTATKVIKRGRFYSMLVDDKWYGLGSNDPGFSDGAMVEFEVTQNGDYFNAKNVKVLGKSATKPVTTGSRTVNNNEKEDYFRRKEERDVLNDKLRNIGAGRNTAIAFVDLLVKADAIKLPAAQNKKADALFEAVEYYRVKFEQQSDSPVQVSGSEEVEENDNDEGDEDYE